MKTTPTTSGGETAATRKKATRSTRYTDEQKAEVVNFVREHDKAHGRGGQSAAAEKFGVSTLTISKWLKGSGKPGRKPGRKPSAKKTSGREPAATGTASAADTSPLQRMMAIQQEMERLRAEYEDLKATL